jgi:hypothetical protein
MLLTSNRRDYRWGDRSPEQNYRGTKERTRLTNLHRGVGNQEVETIIRTKS